MVYTESDLMSNKDFYILNEGVYIEEDNLKTKAKLIPIKENNSIDAFVVNYTSLNELCESEDIDYDEAIHVIAKENELYPGMIAISVSEETLVEYPNLIDDIPQVVVQPMSKNDIVGIYVESVIETVLETEQIDELDNLLFSVLDESVSGKLGAALMAGGIGAMAHAGIQQRRLENDMEKAGGEYGIRLGQFKVADRFNRQANIAHSQMGGSLMFSTGLGLSLANLIGSKLGPSAVKKIDKIYDSYKDKPNSVIAKMITKLRNVSNKLSNSAIQKNLPANKSSLIKRLIAKIKSVIAKLTNSIKQ